MAAAITYPYEVSAIVLAYNRCEEVLITIEKLKAYRKEIPFDMEIIVVDNASADNTSEKIREKHPDVVLITKPVNNGIAGWNEGFKIAKGKYFLVLDDDSHIHSGLVEAVKRLDENRDIGILPFQITDEQFGFDPNLDPEKAWKDGDNVAGFIGCGALIKKEVFDKIGGFANWIHVYTHEFEYGIRCIDAGYRINFFGKGIVVHRVSPLNRSVKRMRIFATRNELLLVYKYFRVQRQKYLWRVLVNNLKFIKREGLLSGLYIMQGYYQFLVKKSALGVTPVSAKTQNFFAGHFWSTKPVLNKKN